MNDVERNESGNDSVIDQEKPDSAHHQGLGTSGKHDITDADGAVDDLANDVTDTANDVKSSGEAGI